MKEKLDNNNATKTQSDNGFNPELNYCIGYMMIFDIRGKQVACSDWKTVSIILRIYPKISSLKSNFIYDTKKQERTWKQEADGPHRSPEQQYLCHSILKFNMQHLKYIFKHIFKELTID